MPPGAQIWYACVAKDGVVVAEEAACAGNANLVAAQLIRKLQDNPRGKNRCSFAQDGQLFHALTSPHTSSVMCVCMTDEAMGRRLPFAFLDDISSRFCDAHSAATAAEEQFSLNDEFAPVLAARMEFYSNNPQADAISRSQVAMEDVRAIMIGNMEQVLERGEKIELLVNKTDSLQAQAFTFRRQAKSVDSQTWWKNVRMIIAFFVVIATIGSLLILWLHRR